MLLPLLAALILAPLFWLLAVRRHRRDALALLSLIGLGAYDPHLLLLVLAVVGSLFIALRSMARLERPMRRTVAGLGFILLALLFLWNKLAGGGGGGALASQSGLVFLGVSYLVLKAAAVLIDAVRGSRPPPDFRTLLAWVVFLPTFPSGPIEELEHFGAQSPRIDGARAAAGLERILFGMVKALLCAHYLGQWASPIMAAPEAHGQITLLLATYAFTLRFYLDFAGYSDMAIGLAAIYGYEIQENFASPLIRRNLVSLWQHWHMTLTHWLRLYLFIPVSRAIMRRGGPRWDTAGIVAGQLTAMVFCGLWHGLGWNFAIWGLLQALGLLWVGVAARRLGRHLPDPLVRWWRRHPVAYALSALITFHAFALSNILVVAHLPQSLAFYRQLFGLG
jgi:alginate O-acetyltransferase complex protein AlgI